MDYKNKSTDSIERYIDPKTGEKRLLYNDFIDVPADENWNPKPIPGPVFLPIEPGHPSFMQRATAVVDMVTNLANSPAENSEVRLKAMDMLAKFYGLYERDHQQKKQAAVQIVQNAERQLNIKFEPPKPSRSFHPDDPEWFIENGYKSYDEFMSEQMKNYRELVAKQEEAERAESAKLAKPADVQNEQDTGSGNN